MKRPGNINLDGDVNREDAALTLAHLGSAAGSIWSTGDFNFDGATTLVDVAILQAHLGQTLTPAPALSPTGVPEPSGLVLLWLGLMATGAFGRYRRTQERSA